MRSQVLSRGKVTQVVEFLGLRARSQLPTLKGVRGACWKLRDRLRRGTNLLNYTVLHPNPTNKLVRTHSAPFLVLGQATGYLGLIWLTTTQTRGKPPPSPIYYSMHLSAALASKWLFFPGLPKWSPETIPIWTPGTLGAHNFSPQTWIGTRSEPKL